jgi:peptidoglycan/LPS O-acetylase OafA/YrhL
MAADRTEVVDRGVLGSSEQAGTAPGDRRFRPDVEGLRAVAVGLVVLFHAGVPGIEGGYVGVDVFFVISGFVITGVLLRERSTTGGTSILDFYARRARRILPAATVVIVTTVVVSFFVLGTVSGDQVADDGRWAAAFLSNVHFQSLGTNYFTASLPPSPLQNYWSLSVEEQFYVVFPTLFLLVAGAGLRRRRRWSPPARMAAACGVVIVASFTLSVVQTAAHPAAAYFSPFTRAWELALGALVAVSTVWLRRLPRHLGGILTWIGLALVMAAALAFDAQTPYPGAWVAVPVLGAGLIIAGGLGQPPFGAEALLGRRPLQWMGQRSYSLYLWHWPILIIAAERVGKTRLPLGESLILVGVALVVSAVTFATVENPIRHWRMSSRSSVTAGMATVLLTIALLSLLIGATTDSAPRVTVTSTTGTAAVLAAVASAPHIRTLPADLQPPLSRASNDWGGFFGAPECQNAVPDTTEDLDRCTVGDRHGTHLMVAYGDSHILMWLPALVAVADRSHWRLVVMGKPYCPAGLVTPVDPPGWGPVDGPYRVCDQWHQWAIRTIERLHPNLLVVSQNTPLLAPASADGAQHEISPVQSGRGLLAFFRSIHDPGVEKVVLGDIPKLAEPPPACLSAHPNDVQVCSVPVQAASDSEGLYNWGELLAVTKVGGRYIQTTPWFCSRVCTAVVGNHVVYMDQLHMTATYAQYLATVMGQALSPSMVGGSQP